VAGGAGGCGFVCVCVLSAPITCSCLFFAFSSVASYCSIVVAGGFGIVPRVGIPAVIHVPRAVAAWVLAAVLAVSFVVPVWGVR
jgi:hypothetical protein